jgi:hypothetical protein
MLSFTESRRECSALRQRSADLCRRAAAARAHAYSALDPGRDAASLIDRATLLMALRGVLTKARAEVAELIVHLPTPPGATRH